MGRRPKNNDIPVARLHKGQARIRIQGQEFYCGPWGSPEARAEQDRLITAWIAGGRTSPPPRRQKNPPAAPHAQAPNPPEPTCPGPRSWLPDHQPADLRAISAHVEPDVPPGVDSLATSALAGAATVQKVTPESAFAFGLTVGEIASSWLDWIERERCPRGKDRTSLYYGGRQAVLALEDFWDYPAASFGSRELIAVQEKLERTPVVSKPKDPDKPPKVRRRKRTTINDTVGRIRQLFRWAALRGLLPREVWPIIEADLRLVKPLLRGQTEAPDGPVDKTVPDELVDATLKAIPDVAADLLRFQRLTGCRPGEARQLCLRDIDRRDLPLHQGMWVWRVPEWKLSWRERHIPRVIVIGPKAQAILQRWIDRVDGDVGRTLFSPTFSERQPTRWSKGGVVAASRRRTKKQRKTAETYSKGSLNQCVRRACLKLGIPSWTPNQLRHSRLTQIREYQDLEQACAVGGHSKVNQTTLYARVQLTKAIEAAKTG